MEQPLVSIVVVSYNHSKYIRENLDSIKAQTYPNIELIIADDASKDNSVEVFESWLAENNYPAKKNFHQQNTGLATTLNECTDMISGKYVKMIAADDYLHPEAIEKCVAKLEGLGEEYGMVFTDIYAVNEKSAMRSELYGTLSTFADYEPDKLKKALLKDNIIPALTVVMKTFVLKETGLYDNSYLTEDYYRWLKINNKYHIAFIPQKLAYYRLHETNISNTRLDKILEDNVRLKILYDHDGISKEFVNNYFLQHYITGKRLNKEASALYKNYSFKIKRLDYALRYNIPVSIYKRILKYL